MNASQLVTYLNAIGVGDFDGIRAKLAEAGQACLDLEHPELADKLKEAGQALSQGDLRTYRKRLETVIARLGHVR